MVAMPKKVQDRLIAGLKKFQPVLAAAKARDVNESDTSVIVTDMLCELLGYDKYSDLTTEHSIKNTFCDLAVKVENKLRLLIELKSIGIALKENHLKQAVDYAANQGVDWVILSNGEYWKIYRVLFEKPINCELIQEFNFLNLNAKNEDDLALLYLICKEAWAKSVLDSYLDEKELLNKFTIGCILLSDEVVAVARRTLHKLSPDVKISEEAIRNIIEKEVIKREILTDDKIDKIRRKLLRITTKEKKPKPDQPSETDSDDSALN